MPISEIAQTSGLSENTVKKWFDRYEREGFTGLLDRNMAHKKSVLDSVDSALIVSCVEAHPQDLTQAVAQLSAESGLLVSEWILRNYLKKKKWTYKRVRKSLKPQRDEDACQDFGETLATLLQSHQQGETTVWFCDECGFHLNPQSVYAWQAPDAPLILPANRTKALNVLGLITIDNQGEFYEFEGAMNAELFGQCMDNFIQNNTSENKQHLIILDNASSHKSRLIKELSKEWEKKQITLCFLPPYSPEHNYIEILWKMIKHYWLDVKDWLTTQTLKDKIIHILQNFGKQFTINFQI